MTYIQLYSMFTIVLCTGLPALEASAQVYVIIISVGPKAALPDLTADSWNASPNQFNQISDVRKGSG